MGDFDIGVLAESDGGELVAIEGSFGERTLLELGGGVSGGDWLGLVVDASGGEEQSGDEEERTRGDRRCGWLRIFGGGAE